VGRVQEPERSHIHVPSRAAPASFFQEAANIGSLLVQVLRQHSCTRARVLAHSQKLMEIMNIYEANEAMIKICCNRCCCSMAKLPRRHHPVRKCRLMPVWAQGGAPSTNGMGRPPCSP